MYKTQNSYLVGLISIFSVMVCLSACSDKSKQYKAADQNIANQGFGLSSLASLDKVAWQKNSGWEQAGSAQLSQDKRQFLISEGTGVLVNQGTTENNAQPSSLVTVNEYQDVLVSMDFNLTESTQSGLYLHGRYRINISNIFGLEQWWPGWMGGLHPRWDEDREWKSYDGVAATANPSKAPGEWQRLEIAFKAPRFDENGYKVEYAQLVEVKFNGVTIHQNQIATGPSRYAGVNNEAAKGPIVILGGNGKLAIRNLEISAQDYSLVAAVKDVPEDQKVPMGPETGKPMYNLVAIGKALFTAKGCKECHEINPAANSVKTGPKLYGVFRPEPIKLKVYDSSEKHAATLLGDKEYFAKSLRQPMVHLAMRTLDDGSEKKFLPIMPAFNQDALTDGDLDALLAYVESLNPEPNKGLEVIWLEHPEKPYVLAEDLTSELVGQVPRIARVNISDVTSGRVYHVGQPNKMNYSFDPRTLAIEMAWSGRFLSLKNEKQGRADAPSEPGKLARIWQPSVLSHLFQPILANGQAVDFSFREPPRMHGPISKELLAHATDFKDEIAKIDAQFIGLDSPQGEIPTFHYRVNENLISMRFELEQSSLLKAKFHFVNKTEQRLNISNVSLSDTQVSSGEIINGQWIIGPGQFDNVSFVAKVEGTPKFEAQDDPILTQSNAPQPLVWTDSVADIQSLPAGYKLQNGSTPNDKFGRNVLFEPLGIAFNQQGDSYVSTRTAGVWKISNGQWQQFAEGVFGSLGLVVDSSNSVVIGEKPGLTKLIDKDNDGWAESRQNLTDQFRFNGNYHEYLHGPALAKDGSLLFTLNLGHGLPGNYSANATMGTNGGYRGWALKVDPYGNTHTIADGLRSPAGLAVHESGIAYYTDNQGDYFGTSKLHKLTEGAYYGHPAGLVDRKGMVLGDEAISWENNKQTRDIAVALLPHAIAMNSPGSPVWDYSDNQFGPYAGQMFIGDQSQSNIFRVHTEVVNGVEQAALLPFINGTASGAMRLTFSPNDNSMWIGQTGRGWWAKGGNLTALQRVVWDGKTIPQSIHSISVLVDGYQIRFTQPISNDQRASMAQMKLTSWYYKEDSNYGSKELDMRQEPVTMFEWKTDGKSVNVKLANFVVDKSRPAEFTSRVYEFDLSDTAFAEGLDAFHTKAWYTLNEIPTKN